MGAFLAGVAVGLQRAGSAGALDDIRARLEPTFPGTASRDAS
jgi:hypothetical protein